MSYPDIVQSALGDESVAAQVDLGGEDALFVTPTRTLVYRAEGLLSDETVEEYGHDAERIDVSEGRRKAKVSLDYGLDGEKTMSLPAGKLEDALHPVLAGVLSSAGITSSGETVKRTFRFSELTLVVTSERLVKHIGTAVWDEEFEEFHYDDVTDLTFEEGNVATSVVLTLDGRQERFKTPNDSARAVREALESAVLAYHDAVSVEELRAEQDDENDTTDGDASVFGSGPEPLSANGSDAADEATASAGTGAAGPNGQETATESATTASAFDDSGFESAASVDGDGDAVGEELAALREAVEEQNRRIERQEELIEQLIAELRQGR